MRDSNLRTRLLLSLPILLAVIGLGWLLARLATPPSPDVLPTITFNADIQITANVYGCVLDIIVLPERRIPNEGNWSTDLLIEITNSSSVPLGNVTTTTDNQGHSVLDLCDLGIFAYGDDYDFYIRGKSHLRSAFLDQSSFQFYNTSINFSSSGARLKAGETSTMYDNFVNALDLSTMVSKLYTNDDKTDLNQDGIVNSLDFSNTAKNIYLAGN